MMWIHVDCPVEHEGTIDISHTLPIKLKAPADPAKDPVVVEQVLRWASVKLFDKVLDWPSVGQEEASSILDDLADAVRDGKVKP